MKAESVSTHRTISMHFPIQTFAPFGGAKNVFKKMTGDGEEVPVFGHHTYCAQYRTPPTKQTTCNLTPRHTKAIGAGLDVHISK